MDNSENVILQFHPHPITFLGFYLGGIFFIVVGWIFFKLLILMGVFILVVGEVSRRAETFYLLQSGIKRGYKLFSTSAEFVEYEKIQEIEVHQSLLHRLFNIGTLSFDTSGRDVIELLFYGAKDPYGLEKMIREKMTARQ